MWVSPNLGRGLKLSLRAIVCLLASKFLDTPRVAAFNPFKQFNRGWRASAILHVLERHEDSNSNM